MTAMLGNIAAVCCLAAGGAAAAPVYGQGTWETTLQARDLDGNAANGPEAFYDTTLNVTWLREGSRRSGNPGFYDWSGAKNWAEFDWYGLTGWRLPAIIDTGALGCGFIEFSRAGGTDCGYNVLTKSGNLSQYESGQSIFSELAHLFYITLGNVAMYAPGTGIGPQDNFGLGNTGSFRNLQPFGYWSGTENVLDTGRAYYFRMNNGGQDIAVKSNLLYAIAVRDGDVLIPTSVPEPQSLLLALLGLAAAAITLLRKTSL